MPFRRGRFDDRIAYELATTWDVVKVLATGGFSDAKEAKREARDVPKLDPAPAAVPRATGVGVTWIGHATCLLQVGGRAFVTDPVWSSWLPGRVPRLTPPGVPVSALPPLDGIFVSHNHYDHLDSPTLRRLPRETPCFVPARLGAHLRSLGFGDVTELDWWEAVEHRGVEIAFVPAQHWSRRGLFDRNKSLWGGWVVSAPGGRRAYFAGDSGYCDAFARIGARFPGIGAAILPIGAYEPAWFMRSLHMDPSEAVLAFVELGADAMVPIHWGTFPLSREPVMEPIQRVRDEWTRRGLAAERLWDLALGETRVAP